MDETSSTQPTPGQFAEASRQLAKVIEQAPITPDGWVPAGIYSDDHLAVVMLSPIGVSFALYFEPRWAIA